MTPTPASRARKDIWESCTRYFLEPCYNLGGRRSVLDAGCGTGDIALFFAQRGQCLLGIDFVEFPVSDHLAGSGREKEYHDWEQNESEVEYLINRLTRAGDLIVDPFCGGGTIPAACKSLGRGWPAAEIDRSTALIARRRLGEMWLVPTMDSR